MAINKLPVNFQDDIIDTSVTDKRRYNFIENSDGTKSLEDVTTYFQIGTDYGAKEINAQNQAINDLIDSNSNVVKAVEQDFVLQKRTLSFIGTICNIEDSRITKDSLADVYFTSETIYAAEKADISVETVDGAVIISASRVPEIDLVATIKIKVV